ncbi:MAG TPA: DUF6086 family protein [Pseudonocardiaceae bacterium]|jgi:hypothetical protein|nr:DUF6086 family protein [Pseudonocardiaceae bacterium]
MSQYFQVGDKDVWNPSNGVGLLFLRSAEALAPIAGLPTGISAANADEWVIDMPAFAEFVGALVDRYQRSTHVILRSLMEGFIATLLVLVERGGGDIPSLGTSPGRDVTDISVTENGLGDHPPAGRLIELRAAHARAMPG